jgi:hypothetical protein
VWAKIIAALKHHGDELLPESNEPGAGVRWSLPRGRARLIGLIRFNPSTYSTSYQR